MLIDHDVLIGKENWLFLHQGAQRQFDYLDGTLQPSKESIQNFVKNIIERKNYCDEKNIVYRHIVFPSKPLLKKNYLPEHYSEIKSLFISSYYNELVQASNNRCEEYCLYPFNELTKAEEHISTFFKYDTHMSSYGNLLVANLLINSLNIMEITAQDYTPVSSLMGGDLANMRSSSDKNTETIYSINHKHAHTFSNGKDLPSNTNHVIIKHNSFSRTKLRVLIFGDSFFQNLLNFLEFVFQDIMYVRSTFMHTDIIELYQPDLVFTGNAERYLSKVDSDGNKNNFLFALYGNKEYDLNAEYLNAFKAELSFKHNHHLYNNWIKKIVLPFILKIKSTSQDLVRISDDDLRFKVLSHNPMIYLHDAPLFPNVEYQLTISLFSSINSELHLYYSDYRHIGYAFQEDRKIIKKIQQGYNNIVIHLNYDFLGKKLRIDPIKRNGEIKIIKMSIEKSQYEA